MKSGVRPPMPYHGGKQRIAGQIVALFGEHRHYVEPFAGGLAVLLAKPPSRVETVNDLDQALCTFWRVLRDRPEELIRVCLLTPHSRAEPKASQDLPTTAPDELGSDEGLDELEVARRVWVQLSQGRCGTGHRQGWRFTIDGTASSPFSRYLTGYLARMPAAAARLAGVQLECRDAMTVIADYGDRGDTLLYVDPALPGRHPGPAGLPTRHGRSGRPPAAGRGAAQLSGQGGDLQLPVGAV